MSNGGARPGAGRKKGSQNQRTQEIIARASADGITPLEFMLNIMRGEAPEGSDADAILAHRAMQFDAAKSCAPYIHPRLQAQVNPLDPSKPPVTRLEVEIVGPR